MTFVRPSLKQIFRYCLVSITSLWLLAVVMIAGLRFIDPPTTAVQMQRHLQAIFGGKPYSKHYTFVPLKQISPELQHAVIAAEDARFYKHHGFDFEEIQKAVHEDKEGGRVRGASTLTQQLVKNLFFGTGRSVLRKAGEASLVPVAEFVLGKQRILELYLNVVEWGPGVYGADAAARYHYRSSARSLNRQQAARLAAILPAPLKRRPERMNSYSSIIQTRMRQMGW